MPPKAGNVNIFGNMNSEENKECQNSFVSGQIIAKFQLFFSQDEKSILDKNIQGVYIDALPCLYFKSYKI